MTDGPGLLPGAPEYLQRLFEGGVDGVQLSAVLFENTRSSDCHGGILLGLTSGLGGGLKVRCGRRRRTGWALRSRHFMCHEECLLMRGYVRPEGPDLEEWK